MGEPNGVPPASVEDGFRALLLRRESLFFGGIFGLFLDEGFSLVGDDSEGAFCAG